MLDSRYALYSALTMALLLGAGNQALAHEADAQTAMSAELAQGNGDRAVALGEAAVARAPQDAALRAALGHAYLRAGRFEAAASALGDALALGDGSEGTTLGLALAQIACGENRAALATLDHGGHIAPAELGLALALAGDAEHGIAVLSDGVRSGAAGPRLRQNLAYAYALAGRWADAEVTAGFDLPPDQVEKRLEQWAQTMQFGGERIRIARLLAVPVVADSGMPEALALSGSPIAPEPASAPALAIAPASDAAPLPPVPTAAAAVAAPMPMASAAPFAPVEQHAARTAATPGLTLFHRLAVQAHGANPTSAHFVQLAAYHSLHSAERGRRVLARRHPQLRGHGLLITEARLRGRSYWRVVLAGFDGATAASMCASLKRHGAPCFAYSVRPGRSLALATPAHFLASRR